MIDLKYSLVIEATNDPTFFGFYSPDLEGFTGIGHSIEDCLYQARWGMEEHLELLREQSLPSPRKIPTPTLTNHDHGFYPITSHDHVSCQSAGKSSKVTPLLARLRRPVKTGEPDYTLFVDGKAIGTIEAKPAGHSLPGIEEQSEKYVKGVPFGIPAWRLSLPFSNSVQWVANNPTRTMAQSAKELEGQFKNQES